ncbi:MAG: sigma-70 family RNA polymerase sigma factor [Oscillospiraceae bacterium]|nr:sigma-70 family RNA polymerase sigma factor [Oscillospiraceae bacterium]
MHPRQRKVIHVPTPASRKDNEQQVETVLLENYDRYYRLAYSYTHNEQDAGDIVQGGAYKAIRAAASLKNPDYCQTWLYRIMLNEVFAFFRARRETVPLDAAPSVESAAPDLGASLDLRAAIDALPEQDKAIVLLRFFEDRKLSEIAEILDLNLNTVKSRLYRCLERLKLDLSEGI